MALMVCTGILSAEDSAKAKNPPPVKANVAKPATLPDKGDLIPLNKQETVLVDKARSRVLLKSKVCLRKGTLELLCCLKQTKEHEAILSLDSKAHFVHAALLAIGAEAGKPVEFDPVYKPATGQKIEVYLTWTDEMGKLHRCPAQEWVRSNTFRFYSTELDKLPPGVKLSEQLDEMRFDAKNKQLLWYGPMSTAAKEKFLAMTNDLTFRKAVESFYTRSQPKQMEADWIFAGSSFYTDEATGQKYYRAEDGDLICVANFGTATLDINTRSTDGNEDLLYEAWTERVPAVGTEVLIELIPLHEKPKDKPEPAPKSEATKSPPKAESPPPK